MQTTPPGTITQTSDQHRSTDKSSDSAISGQRGQFARALPLLTIACLATCALAGLAVGVYDIAYTSVNFELPGSKEIVLGR